MTAPVPIPPGTGVGSHAAPGGNEHDDRAFGTQYIEWLHDKTSRPINGWIEITTPFVDRHHDHLQIYARPENNRYLLTDDSYVIEDLEQSGFHVDTIQSKEILETILKGFHVHRVDNALVTYATTENFSVRKHSLIQAMLAVDHLVWRQV